VTVTVNGTFSYQNDSFTTPHPATLTGIQTGELVLLFCRSPGVSITTPSGWHLVTSTGSSSQQFKQCVFARIADGSEGSTVSIATPGGSRFVMRGYRISGFAEGAVADVVVGASDAVNTNSADPPNLSIPGGWGDAEHLFVAINSAAASDWTISAAPTGYGDLQNRFTGTISSNTGYGGISTARRLATATSENPDAFTVSGTQSGPHAATVAVRGVPAASEVSGTTKIQDEKPLTITGLGFGDPQALGNAILSPALDPDDIGAVIQTVETWSDTTITIAAADLPSGLVAGSTVYVYVKDDTGATIDPLTTVVADPTLRLDGLLRDIDTDGLITQDPLELVVLGGAAGGRQVEYNTISGASAAGVVEIDDALYSVNEIDDTRLVIAIQSATRASVPVPATVVDRNDD
jgi:hypothetical protein